MGKKIAPSVAKAQEVLALLQGQTSVETGEELLSALVRLSTERVLQEALEREQAELRKRGRYERHGSVPGHRNGYESGTLKTAEGVFRVKVPQGRGVDKAHRSGL
jgi:transposase-like protein